jgi:uncharacterized phiE125 gp8 family phage protein
MPLKVIVPPTLEPITLAEAKAQCRVDGAEEDALISGYITAAREYCAGFDWRAYLTQTLELWLEAWPHDDEIELPKPPLQSVTSIEYYLTDDTKVTLPATVYGVDAISTPGTVRLKYCQQWPSAVLRDYNAICITYVAGYANTALVPQTIKQAMLLLVGHWYENREATLVGTISKSIDFAVRALLDVNRTLRF